MIALIFSIRATFACMDCPLEVHDYNVINLLVILLMQGGGRNITQRPFNYQSTTRLRNPSLSKN